MVPQILLLLLALILGKLLFDFLKQPDHKKSAHSKNGDVIDISEAWIDTDDMPYSKKEGVLPNQAMNLYKLLGEVLLNTKYQLYPGISLSALLTVPKDTPNRQEYLRRIQERTLDLVIMDSPELIPLLVISLESPGENKRQKLSRQFAEKALAAAGLPLMRINLDNPPSRDQLTRLLRRAGLQV